MQRLIVNALVFVSVSVIFPNMIYVKSLLMALVASVVLSVLNALIKPLLILLSLPLMFLTLGLFSFVVNALMLQLTSFFMGEFNFGFSSFWSSLLMALIVSFVNNIVTDHQLEKNKTKFKEKIDSF